MEFLPAFLASRRAFSAGPSKDSKSVILGFKLAIPKLALIFII